MPLTRGTSAGNKAKPEGEVLLLSCVDTYNLGFLGVGWGEEGRISRAAVCLHAQIQLQKRGDQ